MRPDASARDCVEITDRDLEILRGLFEARVMTAEHVAAIHFGGRYDAARKRLAKLKTAGYVGERPRRAYDPAVLFLTRKAFIALCEAGTIADLPHIGWPSLEKRVRVSELTLRHELDVQDVRGAFHLAAAKTGNLSLAEFSTWPLLNQFRAFNGAGEAVMVKPDGFIRLHEESSAAEVFEHLFFLEVDRSTEPQETLASRACSYRDFYRRGGMAIRRGEPPEAYEQFPFRVLMVFRNAERRNNTAEKLLHVHPPILTQVWLSTFAEITADPFGPIWITPNEYRQMTKGTPFDKDRSFDPVRYHRQSQREDWIDSRVKKLSVIANTLFQFGRP